MFIGSAAAIFVFFVAVALPSSTDARLNLMRIAHWQNHKQQSRENQPSQEDFEVASHSLSTIATKLHSTLNHVNYLGQAEDYDDAFVYKNTNEWKYEDHEAHRRMEQREDYHRAFRELYGDASASHDHGTSTSFSFGYSMSFHHNREMSEHPSSAPQIFDEFPDLTGDFSFSFSFAAPTWPEEEGGSTATDFPVVLEPSSAPTVSVNNVPTPSPSASTGPTFLSQLSLAPTLASVQQSQPLSPTNNGGDGQGNGNGPASGPPAGPTNNNNDRNNAPSSTNTSKDPQAVTGVEKENDANNPIDGEAMAEVTMIVVLVGAVVAVVAALAVRKWYEGQQALQAASAVGVSLDGQALNSSDMA
ncbi:hypothetical protein ACA910_005262 [Epithemia clementina (nom. ined.)]